MSLYWRRTLVDILDIVVPLFFIGGLPLGILLGAGFGVDMWQCANYQTHTGIETKYVLPNGCFIRTGSKWLPWEEYKMRAITNEGAPQ